MAESWTRNEVAIEKNHVLMTNFRCVADFIEEWKLDYKEAAKLLRECADEHEAQVKVLELVDDLNLKREK